MVVGRFSLKGFVKGSPRPPCQARPLCVSCSRTRHFWISLCIHVTPWLASPCFLSQMPPDESSPPQAVDNFRMLHGREGYVSKHRDQERKVWRIWCWTNRSLGLPDGVAAFGSPLDAERILETERTHASARARKHSRPQAGPHQPASIV